MIPDLLLPGPLEALAIHGPSAEGRGAAFGGNPNPATPLSWRFPHSVRSG
jgi:hypothetical protein